MNVAQRTAPHLPAPTPAILSKAALDAVRFPPERLDALFEAVLINDRVDAVTELPDRITLDHEAAFLADGFRLCRQLWMDGVDRSELRAVVERLRRDRDLDAADRLRFKHMRARLKHFRFACALYGARHRYPPLTDTITTVLGQLQDAFRNGQRGRVLHKALVAAPFLSSAGWAMLARERDHLSLSSAAGFRAYVGRQAGELAGLVARPTLTGAQFHAGRKAVSRQVAFFVTALTIRPSPETYRMSRVLAAINGLMGSMHDDLVQRHVAGLQDYHREHFALPADIRDRIAALVDRYRTSGLTV